MNKAFLSNPENLPISKALKQQLSKYMYFEAHRAHFLQQVLSDCIGRAATADDSDRITWADVPLEEWKHPNRYEERISVDGEYMGVLRVWIKREKVYMQFTPASETVVYKDTLN